MILLDANVLIYAHDSASAHHSVVRRWLEAALNGPDQIALAWMVILAFVRITTSPRALRRPLSIVQATERVAAWLVRPNVVLLNPDERHWEIFRNLLQEGQARGALVMDAHLAALAIEHGAALATTDKDFTRFPRLRMVNPVQSK